jgi:hypothetical protein
MKHFYSKLCFILIKVYTFRIRVMANFLVLNQLPQSLVRTHRPELLSLTYVASQKHPILQIFAQGGGVL